MLPTPTYKSWCFTRNSQPSKKSGGQLDSQGPSVFTPQINPPESWFEIIDKLTFCDLSEGSLYKSMRFFGVFGTLRVIGFFFTVFVEIHQLNWNSFWACYGRQKDTLNSNLKQTGPVITEKYPKHPKTPNLKKLSPKWKRKIIQIKKPNHCSNMWVFEGAVCSFQFPCNAKDH